MIPATPKVTQKLAKKSFGVEGTSSRKVSSLVEMQMKRHPEIPKKEKKKHGNTKQMLVEVNESESEENFEE